MKRILNTGDLMPKMYGIAYQLPQLQQYICYPFPINHIVGITRNIWKRIRHTKPDYTDEQYLRMNNQLLQLERLNKKTEKMLDEHRKVFEGFMKIFNPQPKQ